MNRIISQTLWILPLVIHIAYLTATLPYLPDTIGSVNSFTANHSSFVFQWMGTIIFANVSLFFLDIRLHTFSDKILSVPSKDYWLKDSAHKKMLITKLKELIETILFLINIFFLAIYQLIYQSNVTTTVFKLPGVILFYAFIILPLTTIIITLASTVIKLYKHK